MNQRARHGLPCTGAIPIELDGVFVALERVGTDASDRTLHGVAVRIEGGSAYWLHAGELAPLIEHLRAHSLLEQSSKLERLLRHASAAGDDALAPQAQWTRNALSEATFMSRVSGVGELEWRRVASGGATLVGGAVRLDPPLPILDVAFTDRALVMIAQGSHSACGGQARDQPMRIGSAPFGKSSAVRWSSEVVGASAAFLGAYDVADTVIADIWCSTHALPGVSSLQRHCLNDREQKPTLLYEGPLTAPLAHPTAGGEPSRYIYGLLGTERDGDALARVDVDTGQLRVASFGFARKLAGPSLILPRAPLAPDQGYLCTCVYDAVRDRSTFVILRAESLDAPPLATVTLPRAWLRSLPGLWLPQHR